MRCSNELIQTVYLLLEHIYILRTWSFSSITIYWLYNYLFGHFVIHWCTVKLLRNMHSQFQIKAWWDGLPVQNDVGTSILGAVQTEVGNS